MKNQCESVLFRTSSPAFRSPLRGPRALKRHVGAHSAAGGTTSREKQRPGRAPQGRAPGARVQPLGAAPAKAARAAAAPLGAKQESDDHIYIYNTIYIFTSIDIYVNMYLYVYMYSL